MKRQVQPEILDSLPENHPDALANRRDLRLINAIMGNTRWFSRTLRPLLNRGDRVLEIGAGTGELGLQISRELEGRVNAYAGLDLWSRPHNWPGDWEWFQEDLLTSKRYDNCTVLIANLILHQFTDQELRLLGGRLARSNLRLFVACEPARRRLHQWQLHLLRPLRLHPISRHDGHVSIAGGFRGRELTNLLGISSPAWKIRSRSGFLGWHRIVAERMS